MSPPFLFIIDEIAEHPNALVRVTSNGHWIPPTLARSNYRVVGGASGAYWFCNGQQIYLSNTGLPAGSQPYKTYSMYYGAGCGIWVLQRDATTMTDRDWEDWRLLTFDHNDQDYSSYLTCAGQHPTLRVQRNDQRWPSILLPDIYRTSSRTEALQYGGLTGELPILLGLYALSTTRQYVSAVLSQCFQGGAWQQIVQYMQPRSHQRGVVVKVYTCPPNWSGGSTPADLASYEAGQWGKYFN